MKKLLNYTLILVLIALTFSCSKSDSNDDNGGSNTTPRRIPWIETVTIQEITPTSAKSGGAVFSDSGSTITAKGVCWSTKTNPTIADSHTSDGSGAAAYVSDITGLEAETTYFVRAYATNANGTGYGNAMSFFTEIKIGENYKGGIVAYIYQSGDPGYVAGEKHGLIAAESDRGSGIQWYNGTKLTIINSQMSELGKGKDNTAAIVNAQGNGDYAAKYCYDLVRNGYDDWFLPSKDELKKLYLNKDAIGGFSTSDYWTFYWSSTQVSKDLAWVQDFAGGGNGMFEEYVDEEKKVRAIRYF